MNERCPNGEALAEAWSFTGFGAGLADFGGLCDWGHGFSFSLLVEEKMGERPIWKVGRGAGGRHPAICISVKAKGLRQKEFACV